MQLSPTLDPICLNARAEECVVLAKERGERIVRYRGGVYAVIGYYLACGNGQGRDLCYILRASWEMDGGEVLS